MIEEMIGAIETSIEKVKKKYYGVTSGTVINPLDPLGNGRVQVQLPMIDSLDLSPWCRIAAPFGRQGISCLRAGRRQQPLHCRLALEFDDAPDSVSVADSANSRDSYSSGQSARFHGSTA
jgi:hypothetical protein